MPLPLYNRVKMTVDGAPGTGDTITLRDATNGFRSFSEAGAADQSQVNYVIDDGAEFEFGFGIYDEAAQTISRDVIRASSNGGARIDATSASIVYTDAYAEDFLTNRVVELRETFSRYADGTALDATFALTGQQWTQTAVITREFSGPVDPAAAVEVAGGFAKLDPGTSVYDGVVAAAAWVEVENPVVGIRFTFKLSGDNSDDRYVVAAWFSDEATPGVPASPFALDGETGACVLWISRAGFYLAAGNQLSSGSGTGLWALPLDPDTEYSATLSIKGNSLALYGPRGEVATFSDPRAAATAGLKAGFAVGYSDFGGTGEVSRISIITSDDTLVPSPYLTPEDMAGAFPFARGAAVVGRPGKSTQVGIGLEDNYAAVSFGNLGPSGALIYETFVDDTQFTSDTEFRVGGSVTIGTGANAETFSVTGTSGGAGGIFTTYLDAPFVNAHAVGEPVSGGGIFDTLSYRWSTTGNFAYWQFGTSGGVGNGVFFSAGGVFIGNTNSWGQGLYFTGSPLDSGDTDGSGGFLVKYGDTIYTGPVPINTAFGDTASRPYPASYVAGAMYFDTDLGKPIWWNGTDWVDATGSVV